MPTQQTLFAFALVSAAVMVIPGPLSNPKMVIFFLAFFPQFIHPGRGSEAGQVLILGAVFWIIGTIWDLAFACASGAVGTWLRHRPRIRAAQPRLEGLIYLGLAGRAAVTGSLSTLTASALQVSLVRGVP